MIIITIGSLSGGQGKSTLSLFLARWLAQRQMVFLVDMDPQANATQYLRAPVRPDSPTIHEVIRGLIQPEDALMRIEDGLYIIPATEQLSCAHDYIASSGAGAGLLYRRLKGLSKLCQVLILDTPPARSHLSLSAYASCDQLIIPAEANDKGVGSVRRTVACVQELDGLGMFRGQVLGLVPFRERWVGSNLTLGAREARQAFEQYGRVLPAIIESEGYKKALVRGTLPSDQGASNYPLEYIGGLIQEAYAHAS